MQSLSNNVCMSVQFNNEAIDKRPLCLKRANPLLGRWNTAAIVEHNTVSLFQNKGKQHSVLASTGPYTVDAFCFLHSTAF